MAEITKFEIGSRVYYKDNGSWDTGTIVKIIENDGKLLYQLHWHDEDKYTDDDYYSANQLASEIKE
jgi:hypothetical protein